MRYAILAAMLVFVSASFPAHVSAAQISVSPSAALQLLLGEPKPETIKACKHRPGSPSF